MKWLIFVCFIFISFTALAADSEKVKTKPKKLNFRSLASVSEAVKKDIEKKVEDDMLREEEARYLKEKEQWEKTLDYMEANSFE